MPALFEAVIVAYERYCLAIRECRVSGPVTKVSQPLFLDLSGFLA